VRSFEQQIALQSAAKSRAHKQMFLKSHSCHLRSPRTSILSAVLKTSTIPERVSPTFKERAKVRTVKQKLSNQTEVKSGDTNQSINSGYEGLAPNLELTSAQQYLTISNPGSYEADLMGAAPNRKEASPTEFRKSTPSPLELSAGAVAMGSTLSSPAGERKRRPVRGVARMRLGHRQVKILTLYRLEMLHS